MVVAVGANYLAQMELASGSQPVYLLDLDCSDGARRFALWTHDVVYDGDIYYAHPPIEYVQLPVADPQSPLTEAMLRFQVQGDAALLSSLQGATRKRWCSIYLVYLVGGVPVDDEARLVAYRRMVPGAVYAGSDGYTCELALESGFFQHKNRAVATYSDAYQRGRVDATDYALRDAGKTLVLDSSKYVQKSGLPG